MYIIFIGKNFHSERCIVYGRYGVVQESYWKEVTVYKNDNYFKNISLKAGAAAVCLTFIGIETLAINQG